MNVLLEVLHDAIDVLIPIVRELPMTSGHEPYNVEMRGIQSHADISAESFNNLGLVAIGYEPHAMPDLSVVVLSA